MSDTTIETPDDYLTVKIGKDGTQEVFMSHGLITTLVQEIGSGESFLQSLTDPQLQTKILTLVLCPRNPRGEPIDPDFNPEFIQISRTETARILKWVEDHVLSFFIESAERAKSTMEGAKLQKLMELLGGMSNSTLETQSAGPSTVEEATG